MPWVEVHQEVWDHRKTSTLADILCIDPMLAAAYVLRLWTWALANASDGCLTDIRARAIAIGAGYSGDPDVFVAALIEARWLDRDPDGVVAIHDWADYAQKWMDRRRQDAERKRKARQKSTSPRQPADNDKTSGGRPEDILRTSAPTVPNLTVPNPLTTIGPAARAREGNQAAEPAQLALVPVLALEPAASDTPPGVSDENDGIGLKPSGGCPQDLPRMSVLENELAITETMADWESVTGRRENYVPRTEIAVARGSFPRDALRLAMQHFWSDWWWHSFFRQQNLGWIIGDLNRVQALINLAPRTEEQCGESRTRPGPGGRAEWRPPEWDQAKPEDLAYYAELDRLARERVGPGGPGAGRGEGDARAG